MKESVEQPREIFTRPIITSEAGEFWRVAKKLSIDEHELMRQADEKGEMIVLDPILWEELENTDSQEIREGDVVSVHNLIDTMPEDERRDVDRLHKRMILGEQIDAPIIARLPDGSLHKISGNTRLMVAKALGVTPRVLFFEITQP